MPTGDDDRSAVLRLGSSSLVVAYPAALDAWFADAEPAPGARARLVIRAGAEGRYSVGFGDAPPFDRDLDTGNALAIFWERAAYLLVDGLDDAAAIHGALATSDRLQLAIAGHSGAGKTHLALWARRQGLEVATDEVFAIAPGDPPRIVGALPRPLILKTTDQAAGLLREGETATAAASSVYGHLLTLQRSATPARPQPRGVIVLPIFKAGAGVTLTLLTPGQAASRLIECCLNVRTLPRGGLPILSAAARAWPTIALEYGATDQLTGRLDLLLRLHAEHELPRDTLAQLCAGLSQGASVGAPPPAPPAAKPIPAETEARFPRRLTIGMATYDDYDGVYFTIQALRMANPQLRGAIEFVVVDNNPRGPCAEALADLARWIDGYRYVPRGDIRGTAVRDEVFREASSPVVLCVDSHVLLAPGALDALLAYFDAHPESRDLVQGPIIYDDLEKLGSQWQGNWRGGMFGTWDHDARAETIDAPPFDIPLQGLGVFACRRDAWPGFNPLFRGFGGEEGYIHEKFRQRGGRTLCLPALRWLHRFARPQGVPYQNRWEDRIRNYFIGLNELGLDTEPMEEHFAELLGRDNATRILADIRREFSAD